MKTDKRIPKSSTALNLTIMVFSIVVTMAIIEVGLRMSGLTPWQWQGAENHMPLMSVHDQELGWVNRPGIYSYSHFDAPITVTLNADGSRGPMKSAAGNLPTVCFFGCSFTYGWGLSDGSDYPAMIAASNPSIAVKNFAVPGYATLQSKLLYERLEQEKKYNADLVVYGFGDFHGRRNVAARSWLKNLRAAERTHEWIETPYARMEASGRLTTFPPTSFQRWPLSQHSALIQQIQEGLGVLAGQEYSTQQAPVTLKLIQEWGEQTRQDGKRFVVFILQLGDKDKKFFLDGFTASQIEYILCNNITFPQEWQYMNTHDGHPNEDASRQWSQCFTSWLAHETPYSSPLPSSSDSRENSFPQ